MFHKTCLFLVVVAMISFAHAEPMPTCDGDATCNIKSPLELKIDEMDATMKAHSERMDTIVTALNSWVNTRPSGYRDHIQATAESIIAISTAVFVSFTVCLVIYAAFRIIKEEH
jgi:hypothetical protein